MDQQQATESASNRCPSNWIQTRVVISIVVLLLSAFTILTSSRNLKAVSTRDSIVFHADALTNETTTANTVVSSATEAVAAEKHQNPQPQQAADGIAACLLLLEDSIQLIEWIAYHYTTLPLISLVIGLDPKNSHRTLQVLHDHFAKWNETVGLDIQTWYHPTYYMDENKTAFPKNKKNLNGDPTLMEHRWRQKNFHNKCALHHKQAGQQWTVAIDSDEFIVFNYMDSTDENINKTDSFFYNLSKPIREELPRFRNRTVLDLLRHYEYVYDKNETLKEEARATWFSFVPQPCIRMVGLRFSNQKHGASSANTTMDDNDNDQNLLMTTSYKTHELPNPRFTKVLYDVSKIPRKQIRLDNYRNVHSKWKSVCGGNLAGVPDYSSSVLRINHYAGSLEAYLLRDGDARGRTKEMYIAKNRQMGELSKSVDDSMDGWVNRFQKKMGGYDVANELLFRPLRSEIKFARKRLDPS